MEENVWRAPMFGKSWLLYLYCVYPGYVSELTIPNLPFLKLKCLFGHASFTGSRVWLFSPSANECSIK